MVQNNLFYNNQKAKLFLTQLRTNAPLVYRAHINKKKREIEAALMALRQRFYAAKEMGDKKEVERINAIGESYKEDLKLYVDHEQEDTAAFGGSGPVVPAYGPSGPETPPVNLMS